MWTPTTHCYLCGLPLDETLDRDHVPPKRIFPSAVRTALKVPLLLIPTHGPCQRAYQRDEEYFYTTLLPNALRSKVGPLLAEDFKDLIRRDSPSEKLSRTVHRQFETRPGGLVLPHGLIVQRVLANRLHNVVWKITRGLFTHHTGRFLPMETPRTIEGVGPFDTERPEYWDAMFSLEPNGHSQECFAYSFTTYSEPEDNILLHLWCLVFWETWIYFAIFHDADCKCSKCVPPATDIEASVRPDV